MRRVTARAEPEPNAEHYEGQDLEALADIPNYQQWILDTFPVKPAGRVLEIGAGIGSIARLYVETVDEAVLLEPARNLRPRLEEKLRGQKNARFVSALLDDVCGKQVEGADFSPASFDVVLLINVLEHVDDDAAMLGRIRDLLRPGGSLLLFVPALAWLYGTLDALVHHKRRYALAQLGTKAVSRAGLRVSYLRYFDVLGVLPWLMAGRVARQTRFDARAARLYDRVAVPVGARVERYVRPPLGKNLICVATKR